jgi:hypothetical protein
MLIVYEQGSRQNHEALGGKKKNGQNHFPFLEEYMVIGATPDQVPPPKSIHRS